MTDATEATTLGSLAVAIGGDVGPLIAKLAEARSLIEAFDRDMAAGSGGLLEFTKRANEAGGAVDSQAQKTKTAGSAASDTATQINKLSDANERATRTSASASAALETEAQKNERLAAMVDRAAQRMQERSNLTARTGSLAGITSAGIPADYVADRATQDAMMGTAGGRIPAAALTGAADAAALKGATDNIKKEADAIEELGGKTRVTSTAMREFITIPREIASGNFSRVPGSISILAQQMGLLNASSLPLIGTLAGVVAGVALFGVAAIEGSREANRLANELELAGGKAGFTASSLIDAANRIADSTRTSESSTRAMMVSLAQSNDFTKEQIESLTLAAQQLSKATGQSADDITKDFLKMADSPLKYAEAFQHAHTDIISPVQMAHLRELDRRGDKEAELAELIKIITDGIAKNTVENIGVMERAWDGFINAVKNGWQQLKDAFGGADTLSQIGNLSTQIRTMEATGINPLNEDRYKTLVNERSALQEQANAQERAAAARQRDAAAADRQNSAINTVNSTLLRGIDATHRYTDDVTHLNNTLADSVRMSRTAPIGEILSAASKSADQGVRDLATHYGEAVDRIKKQDLPVQFKADAKAAREAASEAKKLANEAAALERRRQEAITNQAEEAGTLETVLRLYQNHAATLEDVNRAKAITIALSHVKLTADSAEGQQLAELVGHVYDLNKAIEVETNERKILDSMREKTESLQIEAELVGKSGYALAYEEERLRALSQAMKDHIPITDEFMAAIEGGARKVADATVARDAANFFDTIDKNIRQLETETATIGRSSSTTDYATIRLRLLNEAKAKHIELTEENIRKIEAEAAAQAHAQSGLNTAQRREQYSPTAPYQPTGDDYHSISQSLGGRAKQQDDLRVLQSDIRKQEAIVAQMHKDGLINEREYQDRLTQIHADGETRRRKIAEQTRDMELEAAQSIADSMASIAGDMFGKQSQAYRAMFDISKAFAIAKAALAMEEDIAEAAAKGFPQNIPLIAAAMAQGAMIVSDIRSIALTFASGGYVSGPGGPTSDSIPAYLSNGEFVMNAASTAQWRPILESINAGRMPALPTPANDGGGGPRVTVHNHAPGIEHEVRQISASEVEIIARKVVRQDAPGVVAKDIQRPNSPTNKALTRTTTARPRRA